jgi:pimeloyl-ACP methyl ester carboxylesterase
MPSQATKKMIMMHGFLGSKINMRSLCSNPEISKRRKCFLVEMRNHAASDHHEDHNYDVLSDDVIRFADEHQIDKFTAIGHSMGGRTAMTLACRYPDRVDGVISLDAAPVNETGDHSFGSFTFHILDFMHNLKAVDDDITIEKAVESARSLFKDKP